MGGAGAGVEEVVRGSSVAPPQAGSAGRVRGRRVARASRTQGRVWHGVRGTGVGESAGAGVGLRLQVPAAGFTDAAATGAHSAHRSRPAAFAW
jgi:hypothetical protein